MVSTMFLQVTISLLAISVTMSMPRIKTLMVMAGVGRDWQPKNLDTCRPVFSDKLFGCEDMNLHVDGSDRILYLACAADMADRQDWFPAMGHVSKPKSGIKDKFYALDLISDELTELTTPSWTADFVSHGIDVVSTQNHKEVAIYAINHLPSGSVVEKFTHKISTGELRHIKTFEDQQLVTTPNDLYVANEADDLFFVTNDHMFKIGLLRELETMLQFPTTHISVHSNKAGGYRKVKGGLQNVNGITGDRKGRFFVNQVNAHVAVFDYENNGDANHVDTFKVRHAIDNPTYSAETNELIISGFPRALELAGFAKQPDKVAAASAVTRVRLNHIGPQLYTGLIKPEIRQPVLDEFFFDPGTGVMNMSTTAVVDKKGNAWYMTSVFGYSLVKCTGYSETY